MMDRGMEHDTSAVLMDMVSSVRLLPLPQTRDLLNRWPRMLTVSTAVLYLLGSLVQ